MVQERTSSPEEYADPMGPGDSSDTRDLMHTDSQEDDILVATAARIASEVRTPPD